MIIEEPNTKMEIKIDNNQPFVPDKVIKVGNVFGMRETTLPDDEIKGFEARSTYAVIHYIYKRLENELFFRDGIWESGADDMPRFCVSGLLEAEAIV